MQKSHFVKKHSVQFVNASGKLSAPFYFWDNKPHECSQTWQVVRSEFDQMMLENAREHGRRRPTRACACSTSCSRAIGRSASRSRAKTARVREVRAKVVVDASGQSGHAPEPLQASASGTRSSTRARSGPTWKGAYRDTGRDEGATIVIQTPEQATAGSGTSRCTTTSSASASSPRSTTCSRAAARTRRPTRKRSRCARRSRSGSRRPTRVDRLLRDEGLLLPRDARWPATAGCWSATPSAFSIRSTPPACSWR